MAPPLPPGRYLELPGRGRTFIRESGDPAAPALVLLHGLSASADLNWFTAYRPLASRYRVVAIDQRGHGRGMRLTGRRFRLEDCADDVVAVADALGLERFVPVGYSMGGTVTQLVAHRHADRVAGLVLCATSGSFATRRPEARLAFGAMGGMAAAMRLTPPMVRRRVAGAFLRQQPNNGALSQWVRAEFLRNDPAAVLQAAVAIGRFNSRDWIGSIDAPAAVVATTADRLVPPARQFRLAKSLPAATLHPVAGDHGVCVAAPRLFIPALLDACASVTARAPRASRSR
jgi:pimeloyl-ACP methyl ester carboxylesterase